MLGKIDFFNMSLGGIGVLFGEGQDTSWIVSSGDVREALNIKEFVYIQPLTRTGFVNKGEDKERVEYSRLKNLVDVLPDDYGLVFRKHGYNKISLEYSRILHDEVNYHHFDQNRDTSTTINQHLEFDIDLLDDFKTVFNIPVCDKIDARYIYSIKRMYDLLDLLIMRSRLSANEKLYNLVTTLQDQIKTFSIDTYFYFVLHEDRFTLNVTCGKAVSFSVIHDSLSYYK